MVENFTKGAICDLLRVASLAIVFSALLSGCGSGAVSAPPSDTPASPISVSPPTADLFADLPTTFTISGGKPGYTAFSSNTVALPVTPVVNGTSLVVTPTSVAADTLVDITIRDTANASATARTTIKPTTLNNQITITPAATTSTGCGEAAICSGSNAQVTVKAVLNGVVLKNRTIKFDVVLGSFQFAEPGSGALVNSLTVNTDEQGEAVARLTAAAGAATQVATLKSTDVATGLARQYSFNIVQQTSGAGILSVLPSTTLTIKGAKGEPGRDGLCPSGVPVDFYVYGGTPPYAVSSPLPTVVAIAAGVILANGGRFTANVIGCGKTAIIVTDSSGKAIETAAIDAQQGDKGDAVTPTPTPSLVASPSTLDIGCNQSGVVSATGAGSFTATVITPGVPSGALTVTPPSGSLPTSITVTRPRNASNTPITLPSSVVVNIVISNKIEPVTIRPNPTTCLAGQ
jgi:hypothetical protein